MKEKPSKRTMKNTLVNFFIWICYGCLLLSQPGQAIRIKRSDSLANATDSIIFNNNNNTVSTLPVLAMALGTAAMSDRQQVKNASEAAVATLADITAAAAAATTATIADKDKELEIPNDLSAHLHRNKRRMSGVEESLLSKALHHGRRHNPPAAGAAPAAAAVTAVPAAAAAAAAASTPAAAVAAAPYVYYNKMISPDGKQELKEFQLLSPNMVIESVQHDMNYGPSAGDLGGVLLLNTGNNLNGHIRALAAKPAVKHHHKHKSLAALPPFLFLLQQMLQPNMNIELEPTLLPHPQSRNRLDTPLYQFLDSAVDNALRNNHEVYEHYDRDYELSMKDKQKEKDKEKLMDAIDLLPMQKAAEKTKAIIESGTKHKEDELVVTCPIHHEHHTNINGDMVDDDVVLVNECHII